MPPKKEAVKEASLLFKDGHAAGPGSLCYVKIGEEVQLLTCGADHKACLRDGKSLEVKETYSGSAEGSIDAMAVNPRGTTVSVCDDVYVKVGESSNISAAQPAAEHAACWSPESWGRTQACRGADCMRGGAQLCPTQHAWHVQTSSIETHLMPSIRNTCPCI